MRLSQRAQNVSEFQSIVIDDIVFEMNRKGEDVIMIGSNAPSGDTYQYIKDAAKRALDEGYTSYGPSNGLYDLREAIANKLRKDDHLDIDPDSEILLTTGGEEAIFLTMQMLVNPGDEIIQSRPSYPFDLHVEYCGGTTVEYPLQEEENWALDGGQLESKVTARTKLITLVNPHSPTGRVYTRNEIEAVAEVAIKHDLFVLVDHVNADLIYDGAKHINIASLPGMKERTIIESSFSKSYPGMAGWRVGYSVSSKEMIQKLTKLHCLISNTGGCTFAQKGAAIIYAGAQETLERGIEKFQKQRNYTVKRLNAMEGVSNLIPQAGAHCFPNIRTCGMSSLQFSLTLLKEAKVAVHPGITYHADNHVRFNHTSPRLEEALNRLEYFLRKLKKQITPEQTFQVQSPDC
jgi:aminotransferase